MMKSWLHHLCRHPRWWMPPCHMWLISPAGPVKSPCLPSVLPTLRGRLLLLRPSSVLKTIVLMSPLRRSPALGACVAPPLANATSFDPWLPPPRLLKLTRPNNTPNGVIGTSNSGAAFGRNPVEGYGCGLKMRKACPPPCSLPARVALRGRPPRHRQPPLRMRPLPQLHLQRRHPRRLQALSL